MRITVAASGPFVFRVDRERSFHQLRRHVLGVSQCHLQMCPTVSVIRRALQEPLHDIRKSIKGRKSKYVTTPSSSQTCKSFGINLQRRFFVVPFPVLGWPLPIFSGLLVGLEGDRSDSSGDVFDVSCVNKVCSRSTMARFTNDCVFWKEASSE